MIIESGIKVSLECDSSDVTTETAHLLDTSEATPKKGNEKRSSGEEHSVLPSLWLCRPTPWPPSSRYGVSAVMSGELPRDPEPQNTKDEAPG